jgi:hypothetical protein
MEDVHVSLVTFLRFEVAVVVHRDCYLLRCDLQLSGRHEPTFSEEPTAATFRLLIYPKDGGYRYTSARQQSDIL